MAKRPYKKNEILEIEWEDSTCHHGWRSNEVLDKDSDVEQCRTIGYFYKETKRSIRLSPAIDEFGYERSDTWTVPKSCIRKIRRLK
jgi:hypothetical protein